MKYTYSTEYPQIQRLQGVILLPLNIETVEATEDTEQQYKYTLIKIADTGQNISDLDTCKEMYLEQAIAKKKEMLDGGFDVAGTLFDSDANARDAYAEYAIGFMLEPELTIPDWKASEGNWLEMNVTLFGQMMVEYKTFKQGIFTWYKAKQIEINNPALTLEQLLQITI